ncbi:MAG: hypothetical protein ABII76_06555 [Pseudomonadota bacterium]
MVGIFLDHVPALLFGMETANTELICDRRVALIVGRIAGVDRNLQGALSFRGSGARRAAFLRLLLEHLPRGTTGEQASQLDQAQVWTIAGALERQFRLDEPERAPLLWAFAAVHRYAV